MTLGVILDEFHGYDPSVGPQHTVYIAAFQSSKRVATGGETVRIDRGARLLRCHPSLQLLPRSRAGARGGCG
jgi:hypothetical protein